jgi:hypothetical protein
MVRSPLFRLVVYGVIFGLRVLVLTRTCYHHVEELIRATAYAGQRTIHAKGARGLYQPTAVTPVRPFCHVWLRPTLLFFVLPFRQYLRGVTILWTPLVRYPTSDWLDELTDAVAHFLGVEQSKVQRTETSVKRKRATITRAPR